MAEGGEVLKALEQSGEQEKVVKQKKLSIEDS